MSQYTPADRTAWDELVRQGKNSSFLFERGYMDYHRDRFEDTSLIVRRGDSLEALLPANRVSPTAVESHGGLTYGGLVVRREAVLFDVIDTFREVLRHLSLEGITDLRYRRIPSFYNSLPDGEIDYIVFVLGAQRPRLDAGVVIDMKDRLPPTGRRMRSLKRATQGSLRIAEGSLAVFWRDVLEPVLASRHGARPVHTSEEIQLLASSFPDRIHQYSVVMADRTIAGVTIYETPIVARAQYIASTAEGRRHAALDLLFSWLIEERFADKRYFDFGTSNAADGSINAGLLAWKESFGGRFYGLHVYDFKTEDYAMLTPLSA